MKTIEYAGFWRRTLATLLDSLLIVMLLFFPLIFINFYDQDIAQQLLQTNSVQWQVILWNDVFPALVVILFWIHYAATPGKLLCDCKIVDANTGNSISTKQAFIRYIGYFLSLLVFGLGFISIIWDKRKQGWHDKLANTVVIVYDESAVPLSQLLAIAHVVQPDKLKT